MDIQGTLEKVNDILTVKLKLLENQIEKEKGC